MTCADWLADNEVLEVDKKSVSVTFKSYRCPFNRNSKCLKCHQEKRHLHFNYRLTDCHRTSTAYITNAFLSMKISGSYFCLASLKKMFQLHKSKKSWPFILLQLLCYLCILNLKAAQGNAIILNKLAPKFPTTSATG